MSDYIKFEITLNRKGNMLYQRTFIVSVFVIIIIEIINHL